MIEPTIGRIVLFYERPGAPEPRAAIIAYVWSPRMVNLCVLTANGDTYGKTSVRLVQPGDDPWTPETTPECWAEWPQHTRSAVKS